MTAFAIIATAFTFAVIGCMLGVVWERDRTE